LFTAIKTWFGFGTREQAPGAMKVNDMTATITPTNNGYALITRTGEVVSTYSRERDAKRGAARRGLVVA
jgi:hypothetical protein